MDHLNGIIQDEVFLELNRIERIFSIDGEYPLCSNNKNCCFFLLKKGQCQTTYCQNIYHFRDKAIYVWGDLKEKIYLKEFSGEFEAIYLEIKNKTVLKQYLNYEEITIMNYDILPEDAILISHLLDFIFKGHIISSYMDELIQSKILWILVLLISKNREIHDNSKKINDLAEKIKQYIDENYQENISLDVLGKHFCITVDYVSHIFKDYYGISPIKYLINVRIRAAKWLLMNTMDSVNEISYKVGYENQAYFSTLFRKVVGMSPASFRLEVKRIV